MEAHLDPDPIKEYFNHDHVTVCHALGVVLSDRPVFRVHPELMSLAFFHWNIFFLIDCEI